MTRLNVFATEEEIAEMKRPRPAMIFGHDDSGNPVGFESAIEACHRFALAHGLPDHSGYYGCDLSTGEFLKP